MIKKHSQQQTEVRNSMRGGSGEVHIRHHFKKDDISAKCRFCAELRIKPGAGIGLHEHGSEDEVFIIQHGRGLVMDGDKEVEVEKGDSILTGNGESHAIRNIGKEDLLITAIIMQY